MGLNDIFTQGLAAIDPRLQAAVTLGLIALLIAKEAVRTIQGPNSRLNLSLLDAELAPLTIVFAVTFVLRMLKMIGG